MILLWMLLEIVHQAVTSPTLPVFLFLLLAILLVLPFFTTLFFIIRRNYTRQHAFQVIVWSLALGVGLLWVVSNYPGLYWQLWGAWLYLLTAACGLVLEILALNARRAEPAAIS
jgi:hypothetical protein